MTRTPLMSIDDYLGMFDDQSQSPSQLNERLKEAFDNPALREALAVASKDLIDAVDSNKLSGNTKSAEQIRSSLVKYFIRLSTRPTPFGLFSGISIGQFGDKSDITVSEPQHHTKRARPDAEWIYGLIKKIEANKNIRDNLGVRFNDFTYANGSRIEKPNKTFLQHDESNENIQELSTSIRYTGQIKIIEDKLKGFCVFSSVLEDVSAQNPDVPISRVEAFLSQLIDNEFLLSQLRPPLTNTDMLGYVINILDKIEGVAEADYYVVKLREIQKSIEKYNSTAIGDGIDTYNEIIKLQSELFKCKNYLQVDMKTHAKSNVLDSNLKEELERFVAAMGRLTSSEVISDEMAHYRDLFLERYGYDAEVPVLELLDIDKGLGAPVHYGVNAISRPVPKRPKPTKDERLRVLMERKLILALREGKNAIEITDADIDYVCEGDKHNNETKPIDYTQSFELYLLAHTRASKEDGKNNSCFTVAPMPMSNGFGKSFGRFSDMLTSEELSLLNEGFGKQKELLPDHVIAEVTELPSRGRISNVSINNSDYDYQIPLTTNPCEDKHVLSIRDLYIGIDNSSNQFFIKSKSLGKKVIVTMTCMLNPAFGSNALRFLREISITRKFDITASIGNIISTKFEYSPRLTYGKVIIRPETWYISKKILGIEEAKKDNNKNVFEQKFDSYRQSWKTPRFVFMNEGDNRLMLDLDNHAHRIEIYNTLKKGGHSSITLTELGCDFNNYASVNKNEKTYVTEIVLPFVLSANNPNSKDKTKKVAEGEVIKTLSDVSMNRSKLDREKLMLLPGNDSWLYYKLYGCSKRQNELIAFAHEALEKIVANGAANKYFFIRYADPEPHLRIRIQPSEKGTSNLFSEVSRWLDDLYADGLISKAVSDSYIRETERYGGPGLIEFAEDYFCSDSKLVMNLLTKHRYGNSRLNMDIIGVSFIVSVLEAFGLSLEEQETVLSSRSDIKAYRKEFQNNRRMIMRAVDSSDDWFEIRAFSQEPDIFDLISNNSQELKKFAEAIYDFDSRGELTNSIKSIAFSVIHMFCNRLTGDNAWERKVYTLAQHGIHGFKGFSQHQQKISHDLALPVGLL